ncbi:MAG: hypothetical protein ABIN24_02940, partial [Dyadobacter sp.]
VCIFVGTLININSFKIKPIEHAGAINIFNVLLYVALIGPLMPFLLSKGISARGFREFYETVVFTKYASFYELSKLVLYFIIFFKLVKQQKFSRGFFILFPLVFFYGSRFVILDCIIYLCVYLEQFKHLSVRRIISVCVVGAAAIGGYTYLQFSSENISTLLVSYFDIYKNQSKLINMLMNGDVDYFNGEIYFSSYLKFIPRILWENKPKQFGFAIINYTIFPYEAARGYMPSFGLGVTFADFGFISIIWTGLFNGFLRNFFYRIFIKSKNNLSFFLFIFPFAMITNLFLLLYLVVDFSLTKWFRKHDKSASPELNMSNE